MTEGIHTGPQISAAEVADLARAGIRAIICNRPDGEEAGQPPFAEIAAAARAAGIVAHHQPIVPGAMGARDVADFAAALDALPRPLLAYCRSGARSAALLNALKAG